MPYGREPTTREAWDRFTWNLRNLFNFTDPNPFVLDGEGGMKPKRRLAIEDVLHATENLWKVWRRNRGR